MSSNDAESALDWIWEANAKQLARQADEKRKAKQTRLPPSELVETSLGLFRDLLELSQVKKPDEWVYLTSLETVYDDNGDHWDVNNLRLVAGYFESLAERVESLINGLAWSGQEYAKAALKLLTKVQLTITERSSRELSQRDLGLEFDRVEPVVAFYRVHLERLQLMRSDFLEIIAEIKTVQEMDRSDEPTAADRSDEATRLRHFHNATKLLSAVNQTVGDSWRRLIDEAKAERDELYRREVLPVLDELRKANEADDEELTERNLPTPRTLEQWERLARIVECPLGDIRNGTLTAAEIFEHAIAWADRKRIEVEMMAGPKSKPAVVRDTAKAKEIHQIERETPALDRESGDWIQASSDEMREHYKRKHESLKTARSNGQKTDDKQFGIDKKGHRWRVDPDDAKVVWYFKKYLTINRRKPSSKSRRTYHY